MTIKREHELKRKAIEILAQEASHLADTADLDQVTRSDEEDDYLRECLRALSEILPRLIRR